MKVLLNELKKFSRINWWVYAILLLCLIIIYITWKWSVTEVFFTFIVYFLGELLMMLTISSLSKKDYKLSSIFQFSSLFVFTSLFIYNYFQHWQSYYILASGTFLVSAVKNFLKYNFNKDYKYINGLFTFIVWITCMLIWYFYNFFVFDIQISFQYIGFILFPTSLIMTDKNEKMKYILWLTGLLGFVIWWSYWIYKEFLDWEVLWITICFTLMPLTVLIVYLKEIKKYLF